MLLISTLDFLSLTLTQKRMFGLTPHSSLPSSHIEALCHLLFLFLRTPAVVKMTLRLDCLVAGFEVLNKSDHMSPTYFKWEIQISTGIYCFPLKNVTVLQNDHLDILY